MGATCQPPATERAGLQEEGLGIPGLSRPRRWTRGSLTVLNVKVLSKGPGGHLHSGLGDLEQNTEAKVEFGVEEGRAFRV